MDRLKLAWYSAATDLGTQGVNDAPIHDMTPKGEDPFIADLRAKNYVDTQLDLGTLKGLGNAIHTMQDAAARGHGGKEYDGHVSASHVYHDAFPTQSEFERASNNTKALIENYLTGQGKQCSCRQ